MALTIESKWDDLNEAVREAIRRLKKDELLFRNHANERSITHRLAVYLEQTVPGWDVDCEYNRVGMTPDNVKMLLLPGEDGVVPVDDTDGSRVFPDIIVHHRGGTTPADNLLVIEVKTAWARTSVDKDILKLRAFTGQYPVHQLVTYKFGLFLRFNEAGEVVEEGVFERA